MSSCNQWQTAIPPPGRLATRRLSIRNIKPGAWNTAPDIFCQCSGLGALRVLLATGPGPSVQYKVLNFKKIQDWRPSARPWTCPGPGSAHLSAIRRWSFVPRPRPLSRRRVGFEKLFLQVATLDLATVTTFGSQSARIQRTVTSPNHVPRLPGPRPGQVP